MPKIHPTAIVDTSAELAEDVEIGPYAIIGPNVVIGSGSVIKAHACIEKRTTLGQNCKIHTGAVLGSDPQDIKFRSDKTYLVIGDNCVIREYCTVNIATSEEKPTRLGNNIMMMAYSHVAHDCQLEDGVVMANCAAFAGHVYIETGAIIGGLLAAHQFTRIGRFCIIGGMARVNMDILPFTLVSGHPAGTHGLNVIGLKRRGFSEKQIADLWKAYKLIFRKGLTLPDALARMEDEMGDNPDIQHLIKFIGLSKRGITR